MDKNYAQVASQQNATGYSAAPVERPTTDLENLNNRIRGAKASASEIQDRLSRLVIKARGALPPSAGLTGIAAVPSGITAEMREEMDAVDAWHSSIFELIGQLETVI